MTDGTLSDKKTEAFQATSAVKKEPQPSLNKEEGSRAHKDEAAPATAAAQEQQSKLKQNKRSAASAKATKTKETKELKLLKARVKELTDANLRMQAEVQNITRRALLDVEKAHRFGLVPFVTALLETVDNLEKALASFDKKEQANDSVYQGIQLTHQSLLNTLKQFNVTLVDPQAEPFDPALHEALGRVKSQEHKPNHVVVVVQKGYMLNERLLRPAKVQIAE